jgi:hypothetical protein
MTQLGLREPESPGEEAWFGRVDEKAAVMICAAEMAWSRFNLWKMLVAGGATNVPGAISTGVDEFYEVIGEDGSVDIVSALQAADYYCYIMLTQRGYSTQVLYIEAECSGGILKSEVSNENGTFSALASGYYGAFAKDDVLGRSQLMALAGPEEVRGALAVFFMLAHADVED